MTHESAPSLTGRQSVNSTRFDFAGIDVLERPSSVTYATYRAIRIQPTVALVRELSPAPIIAAGWHIDADEGTPNRQEMIDAIDRDYMPLREQYLETALNNTCDYGFAPFEQVWSIENGRLVLSRLRSLLVDITTIMIMRDTGQFAGYSQHDFTTEVLVPVLNALNITVGREGDNHYGRPLLENVRKTYDRWVKSDDGAARYDHKMAGTHLVIQYPVGMTLIDKTDKDNYDIAKEIEADFRSSGTLIMPQVVSKMITGTQLTPEMLKKASWNIFFLTDGGAQHSYVPRLEYLDINFVRGLLTPERSIIQGQSGTRAESSEHSKGAMSARDKTHRYLVRMLNWHSVDRMLVANWGEKARGKARIVAESITDAQKKFFQEMYVALLNSTQNAGELARSIDTVELGRRVDMPRLTNAEIARIPRVVLPPTPDGAGRVGAEDPNDDDSSRNNPGAKS